MTVFGLSTFDFGGGTITDFFKTALAAGSLALLASGAQAVTYKCIFGAVPGDDASYYVSGAVDCEISDSADQDFINTDPITVNDEGFFGGGWEYKERFEDGDQIGLDGTYDVSEYFSDEVMLIFKSGAGTFLTGFLLGSDLEDYSGTWKTPFVGFSDGVAGWFDFSGSKRNSHITVYMREGMEVIPLPAAGWLLLGGLGGFVAMKRRRKS